MFASAAARRSRFAGIGKESPAFAAAVGLLVYPQVSGLEHFEPRKSNVMLATGSDGYIARVGAVTGQFLNMRHWAGAMPVQCGAVR